MGEFIILDRGIEAVVFAKLPKGEVVQLVDEMSLPRWRSRVDSVGVMLATPVPEGLNTEPW